MSPVGAGGSTTPTTLTPSAVADVVELGEPTVSELMVDWMVPLLTQDEADRLVGVAPGCELSLVSDCVRQVTILENRFFCADGGYDLLACHTGPVKGQTCPMRHRRT